LVLIEIGAPHSHAINPIPTTPPRNKKTQAPKKIIRRIKIGNTKNLMLAPY